MVVFIVFGVFAQDYTLVFDQKKLGYMAWYPEKKRDIQKTKLKITFPHLISPKKSWISENKNLDITSFLPKMTQFWHKTAISVDYITKKLDISKLLFTLFPVKCCLIYSRKIVLKNCWKIRTIRTSISIQHCEHKKKAKE